MISVSILVASNQISLITIEILCPISYFFMIHGTGACFVTLFQLGLDQMPDASSAGIISYIMLFFTASITGAWLSEALFVRLIFCAPRELFVQIVSLLPVLCMCVILLSLFFLAEKWLIIEPKSPQSLKNIYRVLKFAAKHKAPLNRSALTYWEEGHTF